MQFDDYVRHQSRHQDGDTIPLPGMLVSQAFSFVVGKTSPSNLCNFKNTTYHFLDMNDVSNFLKGTREPSTWTHQMLAISCHHVSRSPCCLQGSPRIDLSISPLFSTFLHFSPNIPNPRPTHPTHPMPYLSHFCHLLPHLSLSADLAIHRAAWLPGANWRPPRRAKCGPARAAGATWPRPPRRS